MVLTSDPVYKGLTNPGLSPSTGGDYQVGGKEVRKCCPEMLAFLLEVEPTGEPSPPSSSHSLPDL